MIVNNPVIKIARDLQDEIKASIVISILPQDTMSQFPAG